METLKHWGMGSIVSRSAVPVSNRNSSSTWLAGSAHNAPNIAQTTLFLLWLTTIFLWLFRFFSQRSRVAHSGGAVACESDAEAGSAGGEVTAENESRLEEKLPTANGKESAPQRKNAQTGGVDNGNATRTFITETITQVDNVDNTSTTTTVRVGEDTDIETKVPNGNLKSVFQSVPTKTAEANGSIKKSTSTFSKVKPPPSFDSFLKDCVVFGVIMMFFYMCDYKHEWPAGKKEYSRDLFMFLVLLLFAVAGAFTVQTTQDKILNRDQTEEWKGWMQVMFVWYHYFKAMETYNYIRVFIACYVWMTGFGNFSFFWLRKDYSLWRLLKMLFRLNFLVIVTLLVTDNSYMLYYICAMHTYWFLSVYAFMAILPSWNENKVKMAVKFVCYFVINAVLFDTPAREVVFKPFWFVLSYKGSMHEWLFRAGLDHYAALIGMLCAYNYPHYERFMNYLDKRHLNRRDYLTTVYIKLFLCGLLCVALGIWYDAVARQEKFDYNSWHPYTSWVPILVFILLRNMFPAFRTRYLGLFAFLGKITLETYIAQLHVYMQFSARRLIIFIPHYPLLNFTLASVIYLVLSHRLFHLTMNFSAFVLPKNMTKVVMNAITGAVVIGLHLCFALLCKEIGIV